VGRSRVRDARAARRAAASASVIAGAAMTMSGRAARKSAEMLIVPFADERDGSAVGGAGQRRRRGVGRRGQRLEQHARGVERDGVANVERGEKDLAAMASMHAANTSARTSAVEPAAGIGVERRDRDHRAGRRKSEALHRRHADTQPSEGSGPDDDREVRDVGERGAVLREKIEQFGGQALAVRARSVARHRMGGAVTHERDAARARCGIERQDEHPGMLYSELVGSAIARACARPFPRSDNSDFPINVQLAGAAPTPAMRQYLDVKRQHRDAIVLFRMGDFYEMFYEDALAARACSS
jgi:hypothetical protein